MFGVTIDKEHAVVVVGGGNRKKERYEYIMGFGGMEGRERIRREG